MLHSIHRRIVRTGLRYVLSAGLISCLVVAGTAQAQAKDQSAIWQPNRHVTMVVPFKPGGGSDVFGRKALAGIQAVRPDLKGSVKNIVGGSGAIGYTTVMSRNGDPYYLLASETGTAVTVPILNKVPYSWHKFTPIGEVAEDHTMLIVRADSPYKNLKQLVEAARKDRVNVGISGLGSPTSIAFGLLEHQAGVSFNRVVFESGAANTTALLGGNIAAAGANPSEAKSLIRSGKVRALAVFKKSRFDDPVLGKVPTVAQAGYDVDVTPTLQFRGLLAPPGLSPAETRYWMQALKAWTETASYRQYIQNNDLTPQVRLGKHFAAFMESQQQSIRAALHKMQISH